MHFMKTASPLVTAWSACHQYRKNVHAFTQEQILFKTGLSCFHSAGLLVFIAVGIISVGCSSLTFEWRAIPSPGFFLLAYVGHTLSYCFLSYFCSPLSAAFLFLDVSMIRFLAL